MKYYPIPDELNINRLMKDETFLSFSDNRPFENRMSDKGRLLKITPVIEEGHVITVEVNDEPLPLKCPIPISELPTFLEKLEEISKYIDFTGQSGWRDGELEYFFWVITKRAREFFRILAEDGNWVKREQILEMLKVDGRVLAGTLSSPGQYFTYWRKDPLYEKEMRTDEKDDLQYPCYRLKPKYLDKVREWLERIL